MLTLHPLTDKGNRWESCAVPLLYVLYKQEALPCGHCFTHMAVRSGKVVTLTWTSQKACRNAVLSLCQPEEEGLGNEEWMKLCTKSLAWCVLIATHLYIEVVSTFLTKIIFKLLSLLNSIFTFLFDRFLTSHRSCSSLHSLFNAKNRFKNKGKSWTS